MKILFFGDSVTDALRNRQESYTDPYGCGYVLFAAGELLREEPLGYTVLNRGISGNRIVDLYARVKIDCWNEEPDLISILIGVNEVLHEEAYRNGTELSRFVRMYETLIEDTLSALPGVKLMLCEPFSLRADESEEQAARYEKVKEYAAAVKTVAEKYSLPFVPLQGKMDETAALYGPRSVLRDGVHPTALGARLIADEWLKVFRSRQAK